MFSRIWAGVSAAPRLSESSCMLAPRRFTSRKFSWMRPSRLTLQGANAGVDRVVLHDPAARGAQLQARRCRACGCSGLHSRGLADAHARPEAGLAAGPARGAVAKRRLRPPKLPGDPGRRALGVDVLDGDQHADRRGARAAAQARLVGNLLEVERCPPAAGRPRAGCRCSSTTRPRRRPIARWDSGGMSNFWRRLSTRTTRRLTPRRRTLFAAHLERQIGADVHAERLAVQPHAGAVVDRLEAQHPLGCLGSTGQAEVLAVPVHRAEIAPVGEVARVRGVGHGRRRPAGEALLRLQPLRRPPRRSGRRGGATAPSEQVTARGPVPVEGAGLGPIGRGRGGRGDTDEQRAQQSDPCEAAHVAKKVKVGPAVTAGCRFSHSSLLATRPAWPLSGGSFERGRDHRCRTHRRGPLRRKPEGRRAHRTGRNGGAGRARARRHRSRAGRPGRVRQRDPLGARGHVHGARRRR